MSGLHGSNGFPTSRVVTDVVGSTWGVFWKLISLISDVFDISNNNDDCDSDRGDDAVDDIIKDDLDDDVTGEGEELDGGLNMLDSANKKQMIYAIR